MSVSSTVLLLCSRRASGWRRLAAERLCAFARLESLRRQLPLRAQVTGIEKYPMSSKTGTKHVDNSHSAIQRHSQTRRVADHPFC